MICQWNRSYHWHMMYFTAKKGLNSLISNCVFFLWSSFSSYNNNISVKAQDSLLSDCYSLSVNPGKQCKKCPTFSRKFFFNPPTDRPFETIQNFHFQKCPLVLYTHGDTI